MGGLFLMSTCITFCRTFWCSYNSSNGNSQSSKHSNTRLHMPSTLLNPDKVSWWHKSHCCCGEVRTFAPLQQKQTFLCMQLMNPSYCKAECFVGLDNSTQTSCTACVLLSLSKLQWLAYVRTQIFLPQLLSQLQCYTQGRWTFMMIMYAL